MQNTVEIKNQIAFIAFNNDKNIVENCFVLNDLPTKNNSLTFDIRNSFSKVSEYYSSNILKKNPGELPDIDLLYYYIPDNWLTNTTQASVSDYLLYLIKQNNIQPIHSDNTLVIELKRLARIGKDIKATTDPASTKELILKYKNEPDITEKQLLRLIASFKKLSCPDYLKDIVIDALPQTQYFISSANNPNKKFQNTDYIHPLDLFFSTTSAITKDALTDLFLFQNSTSETECLALIEKYSDQKEVTQIQAKILGIKLNPRNLYSLKDFYEFDASLFNKILKRTKLFEKGMKVLTPPDNFSISILQHIESIQELRMILKSTECIDFDERKLLTDNLHSKTNSYFHLEIASIQSLPDCEVSSITLKRIKNISDFYNSHLNYNPSLQLKEKIDFLCQKFLNVSNKSWKQEKGILPDIKAFLKQQILQQPATRKQSIHT